MQERMQERDVKVHGFMARVKETFKIDPSELTLEFYKRKVGTVNSLEPALRALTDDELRQKTEEFRVRLKRGETEDDILPEAFAVVREASRRVLGLRHFDSQIIGGMVLHDGKIAEMKTGEGKTLVAALPAYLNALSGKGSHVVTVNDYLAKRDAENIGQVHKALGLTVGIIQAGMTPEARREAYGCDITYATNAEIGFDYLRDNLAQTKNELVMREFNFCVIDEADSILIDEARTPLIISGPADEPSDRYQTAAKLVSVLVRDVHYEIDEKKKSATLTDEGYDAAEEVLGIQSLDDEGWGKFITLALKAKELFQRNIGYIVKNDEVIIVDEFTGRTMPGRRWSGGQHQAIEAKEQVTIQRETITIASITYQNLFRGYNILSGMTGTGDTEAGEFFEIYDMDVNVVPTNRKSLRNDLADVVYTSPYYKWDAVVREISALHNSGRPILVGTTSVEASEELSELLKEEGIAHEVLNARPDNIERESEIVAQSGRKNAVTIATNMAGRGTDILLGGNADYMARLRLREDLLPVMVDFSDDSVLRRRPLSPDYWRVTKRSLFPCELSQKTLDKIQYAMDMATKAYGYRQLSELDAESKLSEAYEKGPIEDPALLAIRNAFTDVEMEYKAITSQEKEEVKALGGLHVIGTERHESRRIDNQLRGRAGRQGDPGSTRFFLSLEDQLFRIFGGDKIKNFMESMDIADRPLESGIVKNSLDEAQQRVESYFFGIRKSLFDYDVVLSTQRAAYYQNRRNVLRSKDMVPRMMDTIETVVDEVIDKHLAPSTPKGRWLPLLARIGNELRNFSPAKLRDMTAKTILELCDYDHDTIRAYIRYRVVEAYWSKMVEIERAAPECSDEAQRYIYLQSMDNLWKEHLKNMEELTNDVQFQIAAQRDPLVEYKILGNKLFDTLISDLRRNVVYAWLNFNPPPNLREVLLIDDPRKKLEATEGWASTEGIKTKEKEEEINPEQREAVASMANDMIARGIEALQAEFPDMSTGFAPAESAIEQEFPLEQETAIEQKNFVVYRNGDTYDGEPEPMSMSSKKAQDAEPVETATVDNNRFIVFRNGEMHDGEPEPMAMPLAQDAAPAETATAQDNKFIVFRNGEMYDGEPEPMPSPLIQGAAPAETAAVQESKFIVFRNGEMYDGEPEPIPTLSQQLNQDILPNKIIVYRNGEIFDGEAQPMLLTKSERKDDKFVVYRAGEKLSGGDHEPSFTVYRNGQAYNGKSKPMQTQDFRDTTTSTVSEGDYFVVYRAGKEVKEGSFVDKEGSIVHEEALPKSFIVYRGGKTYDGEPQPMPKAILAKKGKSYIVYREGKALLEESDALMVKSESFVVYRNGQITEDEAVPLTSGEAVVETSDNYIVYRAGKKVTPGIRVDLDKGFVIYRAGEPLDSSSDEPGKKDIASIRIANA